MKKNILYIADGIDGGAGSGDDGASAAAAALSGVDNGSAGGDGGAGAGAGDGGAGAADVKATPKTELTAEALAEAMKKAFPTPQQQQPPAKEVTQADFDKAFHVVRPTEEHLKAILAGGQPGVQALMELLHAAAKQGVVMSAYQLAEAREALEAKLTPLQQHYQSQYEEGLRAQFKKENKDLEGMEAVAEEVLKAMQAEKVQFKNVKEAFTALRERTIKTIKSLPGWENWKPGDGKQQANGTKTQMPSLSRGGGSGGAAAGQGAQGKGASGTSRGNPSAGASVFD